MPYSQNNAQNNFLTIKPNRNKILILNIIKLFIFLILSSIIIYLVRGFINLEDFSFLSEFIDIHFDISKTLIYIFGGIFSLIFFIILSNFLILKNVEHTLDGNGISATQTSLLIFSKTLIVPYQNINKVSFNYNGLFNNLLHMGNITLELSGMEENKVDLTSIDNVEWVSNQVQNVIIKNKQLQQAQCDQGYRIDNIFDKYESRL